MALGSGPLRAIADTSIFIAQETGRALGDLPAELAVSVVTAGELELGVLRAKSAETRARRLATLAQVRAEYPLVPVDGITASCFARLADEALSAGRRLRHHDAWIAATALRHGAAVATQDADFADFPSVPVIRV
jgi:predicted nucleic acid-binding protein